MEPTNESLCVFCYKCIIQVKQEVEEIENNHIINPCTKFLTQISRYLNIKSTKREYDFLKKFSSLESPICEDCSKLGSSFCHLYTQWEFITLQMNWELKRFCDILQDSENTSSLSTAFRQKFEEDESGMDLLRLYIDIQLFRKQILKSGKLKAKSCSQPRVNLTRINNKHKCVPIRTNTFSTTREVQEGIDYEDNFKVSQSTHSPLPVFDCGKDVQDYEEEPPIEDTDWSYDFENHDETSEVPATACLHEDNSVNTEPLDYIDNNIILKIKTDCSEEDASSTNEVDDRSIDSLSLDTHTNVDENIITPSPNQFPCSPVAANTYCSLRPSDDAQDALPETTTLRKARKSLRALLKCIKCSKTFTNQSSLDSHIKTHDQLHEHSNDNSELEDFNDDNYDITSYNDIEFQSETESNNIEDDLLDKNEEGCAKAQQDITQRKRVHKSPGKYACDMCDKEFSHAPSLFRHKKMHNTDQNIQMHLMNDEKATTLSQDIPETQCRICSETFSCRAAVQKHRVITHNLRYYVDCQKCGQLYTNYHLFYIHRRRRTKNDSKCFTDDPELLKPAARPFFPYRQNPKGNKFCPHEECYEVFEFDELLNLHLKTHGKWNCQFCNKEFTKAHEMAWHEIEHTEEIEEKVSGKKNTGTQYSCTRCEEKGFTKQRLIAHILNVHLEIPSVSKEATQKVETKCPLCMKLFESVKGHQSTNAVINQHIKKVHDIEGMDPKDVFKCTVCDVPFVKLTFLNAHLKEIHNKTPAKQPDTNRSKKFECPICKKHLKGRGYIRSHMIVVHKQESSTVLPGDFPCDICGERFLKKRSLNFHKQRTHENKPWYQRSHEVGAFKCETCGKVYSSRLRLHLHNKFMHTPPKKVYCCETCGKIFKKSDRLQVHIQYAHMDRSTWRYVCPEEGCGKRLFTKQRLTDHIRTHTKEAPYLCYVCGGAFRYRQYLRTHLVKVHGPTAASALPAHTYTKPYDQIVREKQTAEESGEGEGNDKGVAESINTNQ
ncbi:unnamed protein product [Orchesella dallaii]|uniref:C2H2-type domain-containing protein n=1 Tax=Orchesella dallaii TaxID=48710 RepID=A0ABP1RZC3_9HEXA